VAAGEVELALLIGGGVVAGGLVTGGSALQVADALPEGFGGLEAAGDIEDCAASVVFVFQTQQPANGVRVGSVVFLGETVFVADAGDGVGLGGGAGAGVLLLAALLRVKSIAAGALKGGLGVAGDGWLGWSYVREREHEGQARKCSSDARCGDRRRFSIAADRCWTP